MSKCKVRNQKVLLERNVEYNNMLKLKCLKEQVLALEEQQTANKIIDEVNKYFIDAEMCLIDDSCYIEVN